MLFPDEMCDIEKKRNVRTCSTFYDQSREMKNKMNYEYDRYRVRSPIKSFRDLEVYQKTIQLSDEITNLHFIKSEEDIKEIKSIAEQIPKLIAESYGDRFDSKELAHNKITQAITLITNIITKVDLLREKFSESKESKEILDSLLTRYSTQKRKVLNLRKAWDERFRGRDKIENTK